MSLDDLFDKLETIKCHIVDRKEAKQWLFEYAWQVNKFHRLPEPPDEQWLRYCMVHKLSSVYISFKEDYDKGNEIVLPVKFASLKKEDIAIVVAKENKKGTLPSYERYVMAFHPQNIYLPKDPHDL